VGDPFLSFDEASARRDFTVNALACDPLTGELLDRYQISPRVVTIGIGTFFLLPGITWFLTQRWWDRDERPAVGHRLTRVKTYLCEPESE